MNQDVTAAFGSSRGQVGPAAPGPVDSGSADAIADLGQALAAFSTRVTRRELELNRLVEQIAQERNVLLDNVLERLFEGFGGVIPFDALECAFLSDDGLQIVSYWKRGTGAAQHTSWSAALDCSRLQQLLAGREPLIIDDLFSGQASQPIAAPERRLLMDGARSVLACPLVADGAPLGVLFFTSRVPVAFQPSHAAAFERAASQVSVVVQKTRAYGEVIQGSRALVSETRRLRQVATTDALTGVLNRRALDSRLETAWARYEHEGAGFGLIFCDLDHFKQVNDSHGHSVGDRVLAAAAHCLSRSLRGADAFGRYGGEEFLALIDTSAEDTLSRVAGRLRKMVEAGDGCSVSVTASFGVASCRRFTSLADLVSSADRALYEAKHSGRNCCVLAASRTEFVLLPDGQ